MYGPDDLLSASRQRGELPGEPHDIYNGDRLRFWCATCSSHRVRKDGDECPCCIDEAS